MKKRHEAEKDNRVFSGIQELPRSRGEHDQTGSEESYNKRITIKLEKQHRSSIDPSASSSYYSSSSWNSRAQKLKKGKRRGQSSMRTKRHKVPQQKLDRVSAKSKVNFEKLTDQEMSIRYINMFKELQALRSAYLKTVQEREEQESKKNEMYQSGFNMTLTKARKILKKHKFEIEDCEDLLDEIAEGLSQRKLNCGSLEFSLITALIRKKSRQVKGPVALSQDLQAFFISCEKSSILKTLLGQSHSVTDRSEKRKARENYIPRQNAPFSGFAGPVYMNQTYAGYNGPVVFHCQNAPILRNQPQILVNFPMQERDKTKEVMISKAKNSAKRSRGKQ